MTVLLIVVAVSGCSQVKSTASGVAKSAASGAEQSAANALKGQICKRVQQLNISARDKQVLGGLLPAAKAAGLPPQMIAGLHQVAESGNKPAAQSVKALRRACAFPTP